MEQRDLIFALDIGTRKVVGIVGETDNDKFKVLHIDVAEHTSRTMLDGQVHNIVEVANVVRQVKERLEKKAGQKLKQAGVAVAGRMLKTFQKRLEVRIPPDREITKNDVLNLELQAISQLLNEIKTAQHSEATRAIAEDFTCVGYSVIAYELDGMRLANLIGHFGRHMSVEVIVTFLPRQVLESLFSVLRRADLTAINLTLEPIAAINVIIPEGMRKLNIALIDIGAGTSDIAITKNGAVVAYGMVPEAGDEITESFCELFLMDFNTGEKIKRQLRQKGKITYQDILGQSKELDPADAVESLRPRVRELAYSLAPVITELNHNAPPQAVVCVGGGALTPLLQEELALALKVDIDRVGIRTPDMIEGVGNIADKFLKAPELVTPLGIARMTQDASGLTFVSVEINGRRFSLLDIRQRFDVLSVLLASGADARKLYGRPGLAITFTLNNKLRTIKGKLSRPAVIKLNGKKVELDQTVASGDKIEFKDAEDGEDGQAKISDVVSAKEVVVEVNGQALTLKTQVAMNGQAAGGEDAIPDRAVITTEERFDIQAALEAAGVDLRGLSEREIVVSVDNEPKVLTQSNFSLTLNSQPATLAAKLSPGDKITLDMQRPVFFKVSDVVSPPPASKGITVSLNKQKFSLGSSSGRILMNGKEVSPDEFLIDRAEIKTIAGKNAAIIVSHVFPYLDIAPAEQRGKMLRILVDGKPAGFTTPINDGSEIEVYFESRPAQ